MMYLQIGNFNCKCSDEYFKLKATAVLMQSISEFTGSTGQAQRRPRSGVAT